MTGTPDTVVAIIGPGKVGRTLGRALSGAGCSVLGPYGREAARPSLGEAHAVLVTVPDDLIGSVFAHLANEGLIGPHQVVLHCSGAITSAVLRLEGFEPAGRAAMHPMLAFADVDRSLASLPGTTYGVEGDAVGTAMARRLVGHLGGRVVEVPADARPHYHLACVMASNGLVALTDLAEQVMRRGGVTSEGIGEGLAHLVGATARNMTLLGVRPAMTGPVVRGDAMTVQRHLAILSNEGGPLLEAYGVLMRHMVTMAIESGRGDIAMYRGILDLLDEQTP